MRQIGGEKDDPLKRIQEEINEVARREQELREKMQLQQQQQQQNGDSIETEHQTTETPNNAVVVVDEPHSDDSGISASSSPINGTSANSKPIYIRPNSYTILPKLPPQKLLIRATSTPHLNMTGPRFNMNPAQKGIMQRFIASRGKLISPQAAAAAAAAAQKYPHTAQFGNGSANGRSDLAIELNRDSVDFLKSTTITPPIIERDEDGRPIRRGYIPVEQKIQRELRDLKTRESELKRFRKLNSRQSQPDLLDSIEDDEFHSDDSDDVEHCFAPGKLRAAKSIGELCDDTGSISPRGTPSPIFGQKGHQDFHHGLRPALSLAQLCDLDPEEAPSSHDLIAKWESLIQKNA